MLLLDCGTAVEEKTELLAELEQKKRSNGKGRGSVRQSMQEWRESEQGELEAELEKGRCTETLAANFEEEPVPQLEAELEKKNR